MFSFFFNFNGHPRHLHSFPTRRSSDLPTRLLHPSQDRRQHSSRRRQGRLQPLPFPRRRRRGKDRKSTRLNSSHRCISYAVFCLKKKKEKKQNRNKGKNDFITITERCMN